VPESLHEVVERAAMLPATTRRNPLACLELFFDGSGHWPHFAMRRIHVPDTAL
jgi:hypothetical protein